MRLRSVVVSVVLVLAGCGSNNTVPTTPSPSPVPAPAPAPVPAPTPAPIPVPAGPTFIVTGVVHDGIDGSPLGGVTVTIAGIGLCGHTIPGLVTTATVTDAQGRYSIVVQDSTQLFHVVGGGAEGQARFGRAGFDDLCGVLRLLPAGRNVDVTLPRAGCYTFPNVPVPMVTRGADFIEFSWSRIEGARDYLVEVGPVGGFDPTDTAFRAPTALQTMTGGTTRYRWNTPNLAPGDYWVGVSAKSDCGMGGFINIPLRFSYP